jgi:predicted DNA-binding WGR domain protein
MINPQQTKEVKMIGIGICTETVADIKKGGTHWLENSATFDIMVHYAGIFTSAKIEAEYRDPNKNSHKFYRVSVRNGHYTVSWGRIGTKGTSQDVTLKEARKRWNSKLDKGYERINPFKGTPLDRTASIDKVGENSYQLKVRHQQHQLIPLCKVPLTSVIKILTHCKGVAW